MKQPLLATSLALALSVMTFGQAASSSAGEQAAQRTLAERLGYERDAKLLIVHADDLGVAHSVNAASTKAMEGGLVNSASIMVPCPWLPEIAAYARSHPEADFGLHLTLTSEWSSYRWGPVSSKDRVATLLDSTGYLPPTGADVAARADVREVEAEIRAQIERARAFGIRPTHLDSHMGALYQNKALFETLLRVGREYKLPVMISREWFAQADFLAPLLGPDDVVLDRIVSIEPGVTPERWAGFYTEAIKSLQPGVTEMIIHLAYDDEEMRAVAVNHPDWGSGWRQQDFDFFTSEACRRLLKENDIKLVTWRQIGELIGKPR